MWSKNPNCAVTVDDNEASRAATTTGDFILVWQSKVSSWIDLEVTTGTTLEVQNYVTYIDENINGGDPTRSIVYDMYILVLVTDLT